MHASQWTGSGNETKCVYVINRVHVTILMESIAFCQLFSQICYLKLTSSRRLANEWARYLLVLERSVAKQVFRAKKLAGRRWGVPNSELLASNGVHICHAI